MTDVSHPETAAESVRLIAAYAKGSHDALTHCTDRITRIAVAMGTLMFVIALGFAFLLSKLSDDLDDRQVEHERILVQMTDLRSRLEPYPVTIPTTIKP